MTIDDLWTKMQGEFNQQNEKINKVMNDVNTVKKKVSDIDVIKEKVSDIDFIKEKVSEIDEIKLKVNSIDNKVDVIANSNIAHILYELTRINTDINKKLDTAIEENQVEHKKFEYEISKLNMESKIKYNKGQQHVKTQTKQ